MRLEGMPGGDLIGKGLLDPDLAHSRYSARLRRLTSFESALEYVS